MARTKQTVRRPRKQSHARNGSTEALPPSTLVENNYRIAGDGILERDSDCAESPAELEPVSGAKASSLSQLIEDEDMPEHDQDRLPYLPSFKLLGFEKDIRIHIHKWGPPRRAWYCLDCVRMHLIAWCDGTFEELAKDCEFHEVNGHGLLNEQHYDRIRQELATLWSEEGVVSSREFTKPILRHKDDCHHGDYGSVKYWDSELIKDLEIVKEAEKNFAKLQGKDMS